MVFSLPVHSQNKMIETVNILCCIQKFQINSACKWFTNDNGGSIMISCSTKCLRNLYLQNLNKYRRWKGKCKYNSMIAQIIKNNSICEWLIDESYLIVIYVSRVFLSLKVYQICVQKENASTHLCFLNIIWYNSAHKEITDEGYLGATYVSGNSILKSWPKYGCSKGK